jgi:hypothetical protein
MKPFLLKPDGNNQPTITPTAPDYVENVVLVANTEQTIPVPAPAVDGFVLFSAEGPFWARADATAAIPGATTNNGSGSVLSPTSWSLDDIGSIHLIAAEAIKLSLSFYKAKP